jgi:hypothetical protein
VNINADSPRQGFGLVCVHLGEIDAIQLLRVIVAHKAL